MITLIVSKDQENLEPQYLDEINKFIISKSAVNSAKESQFTTPRRVMEAFEMMSRCYDKILNKMKSNQKRVIYAEIFRSDLSDTTFAIANSENSTTMKNFGDLRKFPIEGKDIEMQAHVKIGNGRSSAKCLRIYFIFDPNSSITSDT